VCGLVVFAHLQCGIDTSLSFLEVFGLPALFSLNYLSCQLISRACHASLGFGTLNLCLVYLFFSSFCCFFHATHVIHPSSSRRCPLSGAIEACAARLCMEVTYKCRLLGLSLLALAVLEPREGWIVTSQMQFRARRIGQREFLLPCAWKSLISVVCLVFPFLLWPSLLTCSGRASVTATRRSFVMGSFAKDCFQPLLNRISIKTLEK